MEWIIVAVALVFWLVIDVCLYSRKHQDMEDMPIAKVLVFLPFLAIVIMLVAVFELKYWLEDKLGKRKI